MSVACDVTVSTVRSTGLSINSRKWGDVRPLACRRSSQMVSLTCRLGSELVPVGGAHGQQPVAQVQVKPLLSSDATHHLEEERRTLVRLCSLHDFTALSFTIP